MLQTIVLVLAGSVIFGAIAEKIGLPKMIGEMFVGIVLGPALLGWIQPHAWLAIFSEMGVMLLMFLAGLETDFHKLRANFRISAVVAVLGAAIPLIVMAGLGRSIDLSWSESIFVGIIFSATSISITVKILIDQGVMASQGAAIIVGAAVLDDLLAISSLSIYQSWATMGTSSVGRFIWEFLGIKLLFFLLLFSYAKWGHVRFFQKTKGQNKKRRPQPGLLLLGCFVTIYLADLAGLSAVLGAFFFGAIVAFHEDAVWVREPVTFMTDHFFLPFFFLSIGLPLSFSPIIKEWPFVLCGLVGAILTKYLTSYGVSRWFHVNKAESHLIASGMVARGEMAFVLVNIGLSAHYLEAKWYSVWVAIIIGATFATPLLLNVPTKKRKKSKKLPV